MILFQKDRLMIPETNRRVERSTADSINARIRQQTHRNIACVANRGRTAIDRRLEELDREWDIERTLEANAASLALSGIILGATVNRRFYSLSGVVTGFLLMHAVQGWCPPLPILRRMGIRTAAEINEERYALKALRGDFLPITSGRSVSSNIQRSIAATQQ